MESPVKDRTVIDIGATVSRPNDVALELLPAHAITGCDTETEYFDIRKGKIA